MTSVAFPDKATVSAAPRTWVDRVLGVLPLLSIFLWLCVLYGWQASRHLTPWLFSDELEFAQISRAIAETGHAARRGEPYDFHSLYSYLLAPAWLFADTHTAYAAAKYTGVVVMSSVLFPTYWVARLLVGRMPALVAATAAAAIPSLAYAPLLIAEPLAYPYSTLCLFLIVKAILTRRLRWIAVAVAATVVATWVRSELAVTLGILVLGAAFLAWTSDRARAWRARWSTWDWVGFFVLLAGGLVLLSAVFSSRSFNWLVVTRYYKDRMLEYGLWAASALTIGLGIFPVLAGFMTVSRPPAARTPAFRAFAAVFWASIVCFGLYTAVKAAYISTVFATLIEERNLIYLAPLFFVATALWLERPVVRWLPLALATGFVAYLIVSSPYALDRHLYSDALGLAIVEMFNRTLWMNETDVTRLLVAILVGSIALLALPSLLGPARRRAAQGVVALVAVLVVSWNLAGEVSATSASNSFSRDFVRNLPAQLAWLDDVTGRTSAVYLGQQIVDPNGIWQLEFWNRSLKKVWSLDGTAPGPGHGLTPDLGALDGTLSPSPDVNYVVADTGVDVAGTPVAEEAGFRVYRLNGPIRLRSAASGIYQDGWAGLDTSYSRYSTASGKGGYVIVELNRKGWCGADVPSRATIRVGRLAIGKDKQPALAAASHVARTTVHACTYQQLFLPAPPPPFRVQIHFDKGFVPKQLDPGKGDGRTLTAQMSYSWVAELPQGVKAS